VRPVVAPLLLVLAGCPPVEGPPGDTDTHDTEVDSDSDVVPAAWAAVTRDAPEALMSVGGTSAEDVWAVGADRSRGPLVLHRDASGWSRVPTGESHELWWVHALAPDDAWMVGAGGTALHWDGEGFTRTLTPGRAGHTVFGVWAAAPDDVWAVGGVAGRSGFLWHWDGEAWTDVRLPDGLPRRADGEIPALLKVWGRGPDDVWAVGTVGTILHRTAAGWTVVPSGTTETLFAVSGTADEVVIVGGDALGRILTIDAAGAVRDATPVGGVSLLQGITVRPDGTAWATGQRGIVLRRRDGAWSEVQTELGLQVQSLHAVWADPDGGVWSAGGDVLSAELDAGVLVHLGDDAGSIVVPPITVDPASTVCPPDRIDPVPDGSVARRWNEAMLDAIRRDIPRPGVHARNLYHVAAAMYDAWAAYDDVADGVFSSDHVASDDVAADRDTAIAVAAYRVLWHRYHGAVGGQVSVDCFDGLMDRMGLDPSDTHTDGDDAVAVGNRVAEAVIAAGVDDGANEAADYADTTGWTPDNPACVVEVPGTRLDDPSHWQQLNLAVAETQNGIVTEAGVQAYVGAQWGDVVPFAMPPSAPGEVFHDPGDAPAFGDPDLTDAIVDLIRKESRLDPADAATIDVSPGAYGDNSLGTNDGDGHAVNPATGQPYAPNVVPLQDFGRVMAEFWADGPKSETPPGHWHVLFNEVSDDVELAHRPWGEGDVVDRLEWDVKGYLAIGGAVHDAAITAWGAKRRYTTVRPISLVRYMGGKGQSTDPELDSYDPDGLPLVPGLIELITPASSAPGERHDHLAPFVGEVAVRGWRGEPGARGSEVGGVGWIRAVEWVPYQRRTFVTPAFPGFISGHSTFSRAAAEVLARYTGSPFFPGGFHDFRAKAGQYLVFEDGPSVDVDLQWATYYDAADQAGQSRLWGGIHVVQDDFVGRQLGSEVGIDAAELARAYFDGTAVE
jgi:hypothetical protein